MNTIDKCIIVIPYIKNESNLDFIDYQKQEAIGLAKSIKLEIIDALSIACSEFKPGFLLKSGKIEDIKNIINGKDVDLVYIDMPLTPIQQRNLERIWSVKVIDRTGLILDIFADRAQTKEGKLQVKLAHLSYQKSRLVRLWTHLERQRGGLGKVGGPGETQMESDRRMIKDEIHLIKSQLEKVKSTRELHRKSRMQVPYPIVSIVGYTNAGKSTLFNFLTNAGVLAEDKLFATLDPTMRILKLPSRKNVILSDTVGFISKLPTELIAAFRATLEEVVLADLIIHLIDASSPILIEHIKNVAEIIESLGIKEKWESSTLHVFNKIDVLSNDQINNLKELFPKSIFISASSGNNINLFLEEIDNFLCKDEVEYLFEIDSSDGEQLSWIYSHANVKNINHCENISKVLTLVSKDNLSRWKKLYGYKTNT